MTRYRAYGFVHLCVYVYGHATQIQKKDLVWCSNCELQWFGRSNFYCDCYKLVEVVFLNESESKWQYD